VLYPRSILLLLDNMCNPVLYALLWAAAICSVAQGLNLNHCSLSVIKYNHYCSLTANATLCDIIGPAVGADLVSVLKDNTTEWMEWCTILRERIAHYYNHSQCLVKNGVCNTTAAPIAGITIQSTDKGVNTIFQPLCRALVVNYNAMKCGPTLTSDSLADYVCIIENQAAKDLSPTCLFSQSIITERNGVCRGFIPTCLGLKHQVHGHRNSDYHGNGDEAAAAATVPDEDTRLRLQLPPPRDQAYVKVRLGFFNAIDALLEHVIGLKETLVDPMQYYRQRDSGCRSE
jgi:hypothetical protein